MIPVTNTVTSSLTDLTRNLDYTLPVLASRLSFFYLLLGTQVYVSRGSDG